MKAKLDFAKSHFKYRFLSIRVRRRVGQVKKESRTRDRGRASLGHT